MAYWNKISNRLKPIISVVGDGINTAIPSRDIKDSQASDLLNVDTYDYPALSTRRTVVNVGGVHSGFLSLLHAYKGSNLIKIVANEVFEFVTSSWSKKATLPITPNVLADCTNFMDNLYITTGTGNKIIKIDENWSVTSLSNSPKAKYITTHSNRLYAVYDNILHYSGLRDDNNWETVDESGKIQISTTNGEDLTGVTTFSDHVVMFSKNGVYELYGTGPINYAPITLSNDIGCEANNTIVEIKQNLIWMASDGVYIYNGGTTPKKMSWAVEKYFININKAHLDKCVAGTDGRRYFLAIPYDKSTVANIVLVYDVEIGEWYVHDYETTILQFFKFKDELYLATSDRIHKLDNTTEDSLEWYWISKPFSDGETSRRVNWHKLYAIIDLPVGSTLDVYLSLDVEGEEWELLESITPSDNLVRHRLIIPLGMAYDVDWIRIKLSGKGPCTVHEIQRYLRIKPW
ncbi:MAG: hypothetical protein M0Q14_10680 [Tissierellaceae bacterium]|nr:hypothetical protein [Tissierellaceae bacterium]